MTRRSLPALLVLAFSCGVGVGQTQPVMGQWTLASQGHTLTIADAKARLAARPADGYLLNAACCKQCSVGKACGNSCISRDKSCHKGPGCACD